jgi:hypothetical protein
MGGTYSKNGRTKDSPPKKVLNGNFHTARPVGRLKTRWRMWFRKMLDNCWGQEDGGVKLQIRVNGGVL